MKIQYRLSTIFLAFSITAIILALTMLLLRRADPYSGLEFDRAVWNRFANNSEADNPRARMIRDLLKNHIHLGMEQSEVTALLGEPDETPSPSHYEYGLGRWSGLILADFDVLEIKFNATGRVSSIRCSTMTF